MTISPLSESLPRSETQENDRPAALRYVFFLSVLGLYANVAVYGFQYPAGTDYNFFLPLAKWLRDPSLYPGDAIRDAFPHVQTFYWPLVAMLSKHYSTEHILFGLFLITKLIFFGAVGLLVATRVRSRLLGACIVVAIAVSGLLNSQTPIGGTITLDEISEHAALALAMVLLAGVFLVQGRWRIAAIIAGLSVYVDAIHFLHVLPAFALFAIFDWRRRKREIVIASLLGAGVFLPWFIHFHGSFLTNYPSDYVSALLILYPLHITLRWTPLSQVMEAAAILLAAASMGFLARRAGLAIERRLELLGASYFLVTLVGIFAGWFWLTPSVARFMLQRADSLLIPYAFLLIQIYGAGLLESPNVRKPVTTRILAVLAILLPLCDWLMVLLLPAMILWFDPQERLERFLAAVFGRFRNVLSAIPVRRLATGLCAAGVLAGFVLSLSSMDQLWNFRIPPGPDDSACYDAQIWARNHTTREATFLVPPDGCGFRVLSERSSWGEWSDGNAMYFYPAFANTFLKRVAVLDPAPRPQGTGVVDSMVELYKNQSWDRIRGVAADNKLDYIVQFSSTRYPVEPVYANSAFAIYKVK